MVKTTKTAKNRDKTDIIEKNFEQDPFMCLATRLI